MIGLCDNCALKYADCKGNKDLEKLKCEYYKKRPVQNVKQMAERIAELEAEVERLRNVQNMHSGDLISRADALEQMAQAECGLHYEDCEADNCACSYIGRILNIQSAEAEWIPVSERLPSESDDYLCTIPLDAEETYTEVLTFHKGRFYEDDDEWGATYHDDVLAWMPLPKPYREDGEA